MTFLLFKVSNLNSTLKKYFYVENVLLFSNSMEENISFLLQCKIVETKGPKSAKDRFFSSIFFQSL